MTLRGAVLITDCDHPSVDIERAILADAGLAIDVRTCRTPEEVIVAGTEVRPIGLLVQYARISGDVLRALPECRAVGRYGVGLDTIDLDTAAELGVRVVNVPDYCTAEVADHALGLILALTRGIVPLDRGVQRGVWDFRLAGSRPPSVKPATGRDRVGSDRDRAGRPCAGPRLRSRRDRSARGQRARIRRVDLDELLRTSDVVSVHAPLDVTTHHLIDERASGVDATVCRPGEHEPRRAGRS